MTFLLQNCPRCGANKITFDVLSQHKIGQTPLVWQEVYEIPAICRACKKITVWTCMLRAEAHLPLIRGGVFWSSGNNVAEYFRVADYVSVKNENGESAPDHVPPEIERIFNEAATAKAVQCPNASAAMSRLCLDLVTKGLLPDTSAGDPQPNNHQRTRLFDRLGWLFDHRILPDDLRELADAIRNHGNDGAHDGVVEMVDAADLLDFTSNVLERVYTVPARARLAKERFDARRRAD